MKKAALIPAFLILFLTSVFSVQAATQVNLFQITTEGSQQSSPYVYKDLVVYGSLGEIWGYDLKTQENFEVFQRPGGQFITGFFNNLIVYEDIDDASNYDIRLYNIKTGKDILVAG